MLRFGLVFLVLSLMFLVTHGPVVYFLSAFALGLFVVGMSWMNSVFSEELFLSVFTTEERTNHE